MNRMITLFGQHIHMFLSFHNYFEEAGRMSGCALTMLALVVCCRFIVLSVLSSP